MLEKRQGMYGAVWHVPGHAELQGEDEGRVRVVVDVASWPEKLAGAPSTAARFGGASSHRSAAEENPKIIRDVRLCKGKMMRDVLQAGVGLPCRRSRKSATAMAAEKYGSMGVLLELRFERSREGVAGYL